MNEEGKGKGEERKSKRIGKAERMIRERKGRTRNLTSTLLQLLCFSPSLCKMVVSHRCTLLDSEKKSKEKHRSKHDKGARCLEHGFQELSNEDYFSKNNEFATWLKEEKHVFFSDLSSESARELFSDFVKEWNNQKLGSQYYEGIASGPRTAHNWKIKQ
ncbi:hypothetical protein PTKIN_Ptkin19aG0005800 [Pterospermum kingtungense]